MASPLESPWRIVEHEGRLTRPLAAFIFFASERESNND
jgi:hypothetical protein